MVNKTITSIWRRKQSNDSQSRSTSTYKNPSVCITRFYHDLAINLDCFIDRCPRYIYICGVRQVTEHQTKNLDYNFQKIEKNIGRSRTVAHGIKNFVTHFYFLEPYCQRVEPQTTRNRCPLLTHERDTRLWRHGALQCAQLGRLCYDSCYQHFWKFEFGTWENNRENIGARERCRKSDVWKIKAVCLLTLRCVHVFGIHTFSLVDQRGSWCLNLPR